MYRPCQCHALCQPLANTTAFPRTHPAYQNVVQRSGTSMQPACPYLTFQRQNRTGLPLMGSSRATKPRALTHCTNLASPPPAPQYSIAVPLVLHGSGGISKGIALLRMLKEMKSVRRDPMSMLLRVGSSQRAEVHMLRLSAVQPDTHQQTLLPSPCNRNRRPTCGMHNRKHGNSLAPCAVGWAAASAQTHRTPSEGLSGRLRLRS